MLFSLRYFLFKGFRPFLFKFSFKFPIVFFWQIYIRKKKLNTAPDLPTREEEHLSHEPLDNVNFEQLNEGINTYISQEEILSCIKKLKNNKATRSLSFKIAVNNLPRQLRLVIGRKFLGSKGLPLFLYIGLILPISQISGKNFHFSKF
jgi:hypothetical protein